MGFVARLEGSAAPEFRTESFGNTDYSVTNKNFLAAGTSICLQYLGNNYGSLEDSDSRPIVYVMTYHSIKGLDFRTVFLPLLTEDTVFWRVPEIDRRLFFVGATRSRRDLFMSYHGKKPHPYVQSMPQEELHKIEIDQSDDNDDNEFIF